MSLRRIPALIAALAVTLACVVPMTRLLGQSSPPPRSAPAPAAPVKESGLVLDSNCTSIPRGSS